MNAPGGTRPSSGWFQRSSASRPTIRPVASVDARLVVDEELVALERVAQRVPRGGGARASAACISAVKKRMLSIESCARTGRLPRRRRAAPAASRRRRPDAMPQLEAIEWLCPSTRSAARGTPGSVVRPGRRPGAARGRGGGAEVLSADAGEADLARARVEVRDGVAVAHALAHALADLEQRVSRTSAAGARRNARSKSRSTARSVIGSRVGCAAASVAPRRSRNPSRLGRPVRPSWSAIFLMRSSRQRWVESSRVSAVFRSRARESAVRVSRWRKSCGRAVHSRPRWIGRVTQSAAPARRAFATSSLRARARRTRPPRPWRAPRDRGASGRGR